MASFPFGKLKALVIVADLLIVSHIGRPIEFHCSAPVVTNRAQKILYGRTYDNYLYCEQIGLSLIDKAKNKPPVYFADSHQLLGLERLIKEWKLKSSCGTARMRRAASWQKYRGWGRLRRVQLWRQLEMPSQEWPSIGGVAGYGAKAALPVVNRIYWASANVATRICAH